MDKMYYAIPTDKMFKSETDFNSFEWDFFAVSVRKGIATRQTLFTTEYWWCLKQSALWGQVPWWSKVIPKQHLTPRGMTKHWCTWWTDYWFLKRYLFYIHIQLWNFHAVINTVSSLPQKLDQCIRLKLLICSILYVSWKMVVLIIHIILWPGLAHVSSLSIKYNGT